MTRSYLGQLLRLVRQAHERRAVVQSHRPSGAADGQERLAVAPRERGNLVRASEIASRAPSLLPKTALGSHDQRRASRARRSEVVPYRLRVRRQHVHAGVGAATVRDVHGDDLMLVGRGGCDANDAVHVGPWSKARGSRVVCAG